MLLNGQSEIIYAGLFGVRDIDESVVTAPCVDESFYHVINICEVAHVAAAVYEPNRVVIE